jgi:hypothetical protein
MLRGEFFLCLMGVRAHHILHLFRLPNESSVPPVFWRIGWPMGVRDSLSARTRNSRNTRGIQHQENHRALTAHSAWQALSFGAGRNLNNASQSRRRFGAYPGLAETLKSKFADDMCNTSHVLLPSADAHRAVRNDDGGPARSLKGCLAPSGRRSWSECKTS